MRIHSDTLTEDNIKTAAAAAAITVHALTVHGSRSRARAFNVTFEGSSNYGGQYGTTDYKAATWDEWGMALAHLFDADPDAVVSGSYSGADDFHYKTNDRYRTLTPAQQHKRHRWGFVAAREFECTCGALSRA